MNEGHEYDVYVLFFCMTDNHVCGKNAMWIKSVRANCSLNERMSGNWKRADRVFLRRGIGKAKSQ